MEPPEMINAGALVLKRWEPAWAAETAAAIRESVPDMRPFLPFATADYDVTSARDFIAAARRDWDEGSRFGYAIFTATGDLIGSIGLLTRMGPGVLEIGYWMRTAFTGRGHMTAAVDALSRVALTLPGVERVAIRHDERNLASAAVAAKAGFTEVARVVEEDGTKIVRERRTESH